MRRSVRNVALSRSVLRAYMHGYFMDMRLYKKAQAVAQPFAYETYRQEQIDKKIDDEVRRAWRVFCFRLSLTTIPASLAARKPHRTGQEVAEGEPQARGAHLERQRADEGLEKGAGGPV